MHILTTPHRYTHIHTMEIHTYILHKQHTNTIHTTHHIIHSIEIHRQHRNTYLCFTDIYTFIFIHHIYMYASYICICTPKRHLHTPMP